jgi:anhydro-N-acetylmuramic acid kinase
MAGIPATPLLYAGVMTGTSMDGIDLGLIRVVGDRAERVDFVQAELPVRLRQWLSELHNPEMPEALLRSAEAGIALAREISVVVSSRREVWNSFGPVRAIGVHGQTVVHRPERGVTIQVNAPAWIAEQTGIDVVSDFRSRDIAAGGQGAPLVPVFHEVMTRAVETPAVALVNLGGIANITCIRRRRAADQAEGVEGAEVLGFDTGPANMLLDYWAQKIVGTPYDENGSLARQASPLPGLVSQMASDPYFARGGPKSTGRDQFNGAWLEAHLAAHERQHGSLSAAVVQASLVALTAQTVARAVPADASTVYLCGGGAKNPALRDAIAGALQDLGRDTDLQTTEVLGWPVQEVEAAAFAWLAHCCVSKSPASLPSVTGARAARVLGSITPGA